MNYLVPVSLFSNKLCVPCLRWLNKLRLRTHKLLVSCEAKMRDGIDKGWSSFLDGS